MLVFEPFPGPLARQRVAGSEGQRGCGVSHAFLQRNRTADDHEKVISVGAFVGHYELEMHPEELPAEAVVVFRLDDVAKPHRDDGGIAP